MQVIRQNNIFIGNGIRSSKSCEWNEDEWSGDANFYFSTTLAKWDADFYVKVDDDVHVNLGT